MDLPIERLAPDLWNQLFASAGGSVAGSVIGGFIASGIALASVRFERRSRRTDDDLRRDHERAEADRLEARQRSDRDRAAVRQILDVLVEMQDYISKSSDLASARGLAMKLALQTDALTMELPDDDRSRFATWAINIHESFLAMVEWDGDATGWRSRTDHFARVIAIATEQLVQWSRGSASPTEMLLADDAAAARFLGRQHFPLQF